MEASLFAQTFSYDHIQVHSLRGWTGSLTAVKAMPKGGEHIVNVSLQPFDIREIWHDRRIAKISILKSRACILPTSNRKKRS